MRTKPSIVFVHGIWADGSHVPMLSNPDVVAEHWDVIQDEVTEAQFGTTFPR